jgi:acyl-CoA reductase-like NAD-dependent aldehyde dehydrogenase
MTMTIADSPDLVLSSYVDGQWRQGPGESSDTNPSSPKEVVARVSLADAALAERAVRTAAAARAEWRDTRPAVRGEVLRKAADLLTERAADIGRDLTREEGKTLAEGIREVTGAASILRYHAGQVYEPDGETYPSTQDDVMLFTRREPVGVVSLITPWNFPIAIPAWKLGPALAYGNTVVWKPADLVPLTAVHLARALIDAGLPDGVLNLVLGRGSEIGDVLTGHADVAAVSFTGSNVVGSRIQNLAGAAGKKVQLELGGKNPAIVLADADLERTAKEVAGAAFAGSGQKCTATSRVIVERAVAGDFVDILRAEAAAWQPGDPLDAGSGIGPVSSAGQLDEVLGHLDQARRDGARAVTGGRRAGGDLAEGYFVEPTVLLDVEPGHPVAREEIFGPVAVVLPAASYDEAVQLANDTPYGLSASLFTRDLATAMRFSRDSHTGIVKVNQSTSGVEFHVPFGGTKDSGSGHREQGKAAREFFTESKTVYVGY